MSYTRLLLAAIVLAVLSALLWLGIHLYELMPAPTNVPPPALATKRPVLFSEVYSPYKGRYLLPDSTYWEVELINASFLHNEQRNYYGDSAPSHLQTIWKHLLGQGTTNVGGEEKIWKGAGWTGQPLLVSENGRLYLLQGAYDHHLKKLDAQTGALVWQYAFDDVIKGTGTLWLNHQADSLHHFALILQGSRAGKSLYSSTVPSFRAISLHNGQEVWRLNSSRTFSYSRDVDGSALIWQDTAYLGLENSIWTIFNPNPDSAQWRDAMRQPQLYRQGDTLYRPIDRIRHGGNLVTEASPTLLGERVYVPSGSGRVWGYHRQRDSLDWMYYIGSDIDGSAVVTADSCLLISIEKQYIKGQGGLLKLDPRRPAKQAAVWFFPTEDKTFALWEGGIIGSASVNAHYKTSDTMPDLAAFVGIDGYLYVVNTSVVVDSPPRPSYSPELLLPRPELVFRHYVGPSIATPIFVQNKIITTGSKGICLFEQDSLGAFFLKEQVKIRCESTPVVHRGRLYVASRNGYLYCLGQVDSMALRPPT